MFTTKKLILLIGKQLVISTVVIGISSFSIYFISNQIERVSNAAAQNLQDTNKLVARSEHYSAIMHDVALVGTNDTTIQNAFPTSDNILEFISVLENTALKNGIMESYHFETPVDAPDASPFPLSTVGYQNTITGNITSFSTYLKDFEKLPYFTLIDSINFTAQDSAGWTKGGSASYHAILYTKTTK